MSDSTRGSTACSSRVRWAASRPAIVDRALAGRPSPWFADVAATPGAAAVRPSATLMSRGRPASPLSAALYRGASAAGCRMLPSGQQHAQAGDAAFELLELADVHDD